MLTLRLLNEAEIRILYTFQMTRDFPPSELKGLSAILDLRERGEYDVLEAREQGRFIAYALVYRPREGRVLLLDYLAVEPDIRCRGYGHQLLEALKTYYAESADCLMIECERPKASPDVEEARRRIRFYQHADAVLTNVRVWLFDVEYSILVMPCNGYVISDKRNWAQEILGMYRQMLPEHLYERNVRLLRA